ncbi:hypothetical protein D1818_21315 [Aquimarina sp. BL5]|uniref:sensor histidine kinase n=1 Tax=Aquimarina sp. BL5 TaxID=1714860 RepID=UPI000E4A7A29|nr:sensor histidine kinase [Aquimarina sp. BL5]AXT53242.1 hypothetical protein D1818_21315 [Aquimarina sp. BL5]RKM92677.1 hypothetical protein D7036_22720 [Aquimarina sp. BL5]
MDKHYSYILLLWFIAAFNLMAAQTVLNKDKQLTSNIVQHLIDLDFKIAQQKTGLINDSLLRKKIHNLNNILYFQGQGEFERNSDSNTKAIKQPVTEIVHLLAKAYDTLYHSPNKSSLLKNFIIPYQKAKELNNYSLRKLTLLGVLEFYHYEFSQTNDQFIKYLTEFKELASSPVEKTWANIYEIYFSSQSIFKDKRSAIEALRNLENQIEKLPENHKIRPLFLSLKAVQLEFINKDDEAEKYHFQALKESSNYPFLKYIKFRTCIRLADLYHNKKEYHKGLKYATEANKYIDISDTLRSKIYVYKYASLNNKGLKNYQKAYEQLEKSKELEYQQDFKKNTLENSKLEIQLQTLEKEKKIVQLLNANLKTEAQRIKNRNWLIGSCSALVIGLIIGILVYKNTKRKQRIAEQEREIEIQKTEKLLKEQELAAIDAMISGQEKERQRLANDLHDNLGSTLATVKLHFDHLKNNRDNPKMENVEELYNKTNNLLDEAYQKVRTIAHEKNSGVMAKQGLLPAVKNLAKKASNGDELLIEVQDYGLDERLDNALEISIFRIIQELITNTIKHANASEIHISLTNHDSLLNIIVEDNGKGFDAKILPEKDGMGLKSIEKRIEHMEGTFEIDSTIGKGTNIIINIPI